MGRVLVAGSNSGCGKTTITLALLSALKKRGVELAGFKCGPDYIDPMFHKKVLELPSYNLDPFFCDGEMMRQLLAEKEREFSVIEGVMGFYDGIGLEGVSSTYTVASETNTPVILVVNARGMYTSVRPILRGFKEYKEDSNIKGVIFNNISPMMYPDLAKMAESEGLIPLGCLPTEAKIEIGSRHLGLVTADEILDMQNRINLLAELAEKYIDLDKVIELGNTAPVFEKQKAEVKPVEKKVKLAVAKDEAFCFIYDENLEVLERAGFELTYFSPLRDEKLPEGISAVYFPGGYPELYTSALSDNLSMKTSIKDALSKKLPCFAECGGFMYLLSVLEGDSMVGFLSGSAEKKARLVRFGYITLTAKKDNMFCKEGEKIRAHEFHYYDTDNNGEDFRADKPLSKRGWECVHATDSMYAGFPHIYLPSNPDFANNFYKKALEYEINLM